MTVKYLILKMLVYLALVDVLGYFPVINNPIMNIVVFKMFSGGQFPKMAVPHVQVLG